MVENMGDVGGHRCNGASPKDPFCRGPRKPGLVAAAASRRCEPLQALTGFLVHSSTSQRQQKKRKPSSETAVNGYRDGWLCQQIAVSEESSTMQSSSILFLPPLLHHLIIIIISLLLQLYHHPHHHRQRHHHHHHDHHRHIVFLLLLIIITTATTTVSSSSSSSSSSPCHQGCCRPYQGAGPRRPKETEDARVRHHGLRVRKVQDSKPHREAAVNRATSRLTAERASGKQSKGAIVNTHCYHSRHIRLEPRSCICCSE